MPAILNFFRFGLSEIWRKGWISNGNIIYDQWFEKEKQQGGTGGAADGRQKRKSRPSLTPDAFRLSIKSCDRNRTCPRLLSLSLTHRHCAVYLPENRLLHPLQLTLPGRHPRTPISLPLRRDSTSRRSQLLVAAAVPSPLAYPVRLQH